MDKEIDNLSGVYWKKFEYISDKIRRILTNDEMRLGHAR